MCWGWSCFESLVSVCLSHMQKHKTSQYFLKSKLSIWSSVLICCCIQLLFGCDSLQHFAVQVIEKWQPTQQVSSQPAEAELRLLWRLADVMWGNSARVMMWGSACCYSTWTDLLRLAFSDDDTGDVSQGAGEPSQSAESACIDHWGWWAWIVLEYSRRGTRKDVQCSSCYHSGKLGGSGVRSIL